MPVKVETSIETCPGLLFTQGTESRTLAAIPWYFLGLLRLGRRFYYHNGTAQGTIGRHKMPSNFLWNWLSLLSQPVCSPWSAAVLAWLHHTAHQCNQDIKFRLSLRTLVGIPTEMGNDLSCMSSCESGNICGADVRKGSTSITLLRECSMLVRCVWWQKRKR